MKHKLPGQDTGSDGGIYQEVNLQKQQEYPNYVTVPDHTRLPPTTKPGHKWKPLKITPASKKS